MGIISRILVLALGYAYPSYECYKTVELNKPEIEQLRFWCQYWILVSLIAVFEWFTDPILLWLPFYGEAKLAFYIFLWYPKSRGAAYVYGTFVKPLLSKHETKIDQNLLELRARTKDTVMVYFQQLAKYGQTTIFGILAYVASQAQSTKSRPNQNQQSEEVDPAAPIHPDAVSQKTPQPTRSFRSASIKQVEKVKKSGLSEPANVTDAANTETEIMQDENRKENAVQIIDNRLRKRGSNVGVSPSSN